MDPRLQVRSELVRSIMNQKKAPERFVPRPDETMPDKAEADPRQAVDEVPRHKGVVKTEKPPAPSGVRSRLKARGRTHGYHAATQPEGDDGLAGHEAAAPSPDRRRLR